MESIIWTSRPKYSAPVEGLIAGHSRLLLIFLDNSVNKALAFVFYCNQNYCSDKLCRRRLIFEELALELIEKEFENTGRAPSVSDSLKSNKRKKRSCLDCFRQDDENASRVCSEFEQPFVGIILNDAA